MLTSDNFLIIICMAFQSIVYNPYEVNFVQFQNKILTDYFNYLTVIKARSQHTLSEYKVDLRLLFLYVYASRNEGLPPPPLDCSFADIEFIKSITIDDIYTFIAYCREERKCTVQTCGRKIITFRQFWKYLKTKAHLLDINIAEELETPKIPKRMPRYLDLDDSMRLLMIVEDSARDYCIITLFLNCALRLSELVDLNVDQVNAEALTIIGKGDKQRQVYMNPACKTAISIWLTERDKKYHPKDEALFISRRGTRISTRSVQILLKKTVIEAGLSPDITPHKLRHTAATLMYRYGHVDIKALKEILGHANISTTDIYYGKEKEMESEERKALSALGNRLRGLS